jgi:hypothetical protein
VSIIIRHALSGSRAHQAVWEGQVSEGLWGKQQCHLIILFVVDPKLIFILSDFWMGCLAIKEKMQSQVDH